MNYGEIITSAFQLTLRNRYLWFFGFFVGLGSGGGGGGGGGGDFDEQNSTDIASISALDIEPDPFTSASLIIGLVVLGLQILLVFFALYVVSQGGLTESVAAIDRGESRGFTFTWRAGARNFLLPLLIVALAVLGTFNHSYWTLAYLRLTNQGGMTLT
jgi:hypothetical protein